MAMSERDRRRSGLRRLDDCLEALERAHELDRTVVGAALAAMVGERVPEVRPDMLIAEAIEAVLRRQEGLMVALPDGGRRRLLRRRRPIFDPFLLV